jgi:hypothetical protein
MLLYVGKDEVSYRFPAAADFRHEPLSTSSKSIVNLGTPFVNPAIWLTLKIRSGQATMGIADFPRSRLLYLDVRRSIHR